MRSPQATPRPQRRSLSLLLLALAFISLSLSSYAAAIVPQLATGTNAQFVNVASPLIRLQYASFDPIKGEVKIPASLQASATSQYYIVQFNGPVLQQWKDAVASAGGQLYDYIPDFAFIVRLDAASKTAVGKLPFVRWIGAYQPAYKLSAEAASILAQGEMRSVTLNVVTFAGSDDSAVAALAGIKIQARAANSFNTTLRLELNSGELTRLAQIDSVKWVELYRAPQLNNEKMREITGVNQMWSNGTNLYGQGQVVAVADTGLDTGNLSTISPDFAGRVDATFALGRTGDWSDIDSHGTHVAGTVLGNGVRSGSDPNTRNYATSFAGMAPEARLVFQSIGDASGGLGGLPSDLNNLFEQAYTAGARIHTNSWGSSGQGQYNVDSQQVDQFTWNRKDMTVLFAAGNAGTDANQDGVVDLNSLDSPASAKNDITVGASESNRPPNSGWGGLANTTWGQFSCTGGVKYCANPITSDYTSDNINGMAAFSSRGPAADGRIEPSLSNPGTNIISVRSQAATGTGWGEYNQYYIYNGGTSMATPGVAGAAALVRQFFNNRGLTNPSAALIKATMLNAASDMAPGQYGGGATQEMQTRPNNVEGWGRLNLMNALYPSTPIQATYNDSLSLATGQTSDSNYMVTTGGQPLHITLAWNDYPGTLGAGVELVNDLDLSVTAPDGTTVYWGNNATGGDRINNVETVDIPSAAAGTYVIRVAGINVPQGPQPAALVTWGATGAPPPPTNTPSCPIPFTDINGNIFYQAITYLYCAGVVNGNSGSTFNPSGISTRGQFAKVVVLGFGVAAYTPSGGGQDFTDVPPSYFAYPYIEAGFSAGVLNGFDAGTCAAAGATPPCYLPNRPITRGQITKLVVNAARYTPVTAGTQTFSDVPPSNVFYISIETAYAKRVINGYPDGTFQPNANVRRDAMSQIVYKGVTTP